MNLKTHVELPAERPPGQVRFQKNATGFRPRAHSKLPQKFLGRWIAGIRLDHGAIGNLRRLVGENAHVAGIHGQPKRQALLGGDRAGFFH